MDNLQINITKADTGELITRFQQFDGGNVIYERLDVYPNLNALCRGIKKVFGALEVIIKRNVNIEDEISRLRSQLKGLEQKNKEQDQKNS
tara:strand:- start:41 stop:310 length:270 start_codon:yes stop_codon:yes gene_type:complete